jgi:transposase
MFMQDGATPHTARASVEELTKYCIVCPFWPPNTPDLNPIEMLWGRIKNRPKWNGIRAREAAIAEIVDVWDRIPMDVIDKPCESLASP